jgi:hypothetical protein
MADIRQTTLRIRKILRQIRATEEGGSLEVGQQSIEAAHLGQLDVFLQIEHQEALRQQVPLSHPSTGLQEVDRSMSLLLSDVLPAIREPVESGSS